VIRRGLELDPDQRFPDMDALLRQLERHPRSVHRWWLAGLAGVLAVGLGTWATIRPGESRHCRSDGQPLAGIWDDAQRSEVERAFTTAAPGSSYGGEVFVKVSAGLDAWAEAFGTMQQQACEDTHVHQRHSEAMLDRRTACLQRGRVELGTLVRALTTADVDLVARAEEAVHALPRVADCGDLDALTRTLTPPDPAVRERVDAADLRLAEARGLQAAAHYSDALVIATDTAREADELGWVPLAARARYLVGLLEHEVGDSDAASQSLRQALSLASQAVTTISCPTFSIIWGIRRLRPRAVRRGVGLARPGRSLARPYRCGSSGTTSHPLAAHHLGHVLQLEAELEAYSAELKAVEIADATKKRVSVRTLGEDGLGPKKAVHLDRTGLSSTIKEVESIQENVRNKRQMASTAFQNLDQKANQLYTLLSSVMKAMNEMRMGTVRNML
jgi:hypothetical protein